MKKQTETKNKESMVLSDEAVYTIRQLLQLGLLTGTNVVHHLKTMRLSLNDKKELTPTKEFIDSVAKMIADFESEVQSSTGGEVSSLPGLGN